MPGCTDLEDSCCVERVLVQEQGEIWVIARRPTFKPLPDYRKPDPAYPDVFITPGQDPKDPFHIVPVIIEYPKKYADLRRLIDEVVPAIRDKENQCKACEKAAEFLKRLKKE